ncbi:SGNH hydrolase-type esterase domain-containing protein [Artemisia annua]|uniref:SGNH hydrolase-type esterase domain-containing protein n=1 Tax=Artemisia annua TaxID=35608 RepID=A0A2U1KGV6_ARTAN|nr:SGNH hydrolase-type esterase domain-containing protein [Artemisia annua]
MVGPRRPQFVLFGSSIVEYSFGEQGWGAILADIYSRKADIFLRGYGGWNSRQALQVVDQVFPKDDPVQPSLVIVYFGGNDSKLPSPDGVSAHVPLSEYVENMRKIAIHLKSVSEKTRLIFLTAPPVNEAQILEHACVELCHEMGIKAINLCNAFKQHNGWMTTCFTDGVHLTPVGSKIVAKEILKVLAEADWKPSLHWETLSAEFA